jgi:DNA-binding LacI/PurR family transcriptional regulator
MATLKDVAARAGVSISTVRCALYHLGPIRETTRQRVMEAARELAYVPNTFARALVSGKAPVVALVVPELAWHVSNILVVTLQHQIATLGLRTVLFVGSTTAPAALVSEIRQVAAQAAILVQVNWSEEYRSLSECGIHLLCLDVRPQPPLDGAGDAISLDRVGAFRLVTEHLLELGHRHIGLLASYGGTGRQEGYEQALEAAGVGERAMMVADAEGVRAPDLREALAELFRADPQLTAVVCSTDLWAQEAIHHLGEMGKEVPQDVSVTGYSNEPWTPWATPALTTLDQGTDRLCAQTLALLRCRVEGAVEPWRREVIRPELVVRASTAPPPEITSDEG